MATDEHWLRFNKAAKIVFCDVETFNLALNWNINRCWQISLLKIIGDTIIEEKDLFIKWQDCKFDIGEGAARTTRFDRRDFESKAIDPTSAFEQFWPIFEWADYIIGHNILRFDLYLLRGYAQHMGRDWKFLLPKIIDTKSLCQGIKLNRPYKPEIDDFIDYSYNMANSHVKGIKTNLQVMAQEYEIPYDANLLHNSLYDLKINKALWDKLKLQVEI